MAKIKELMQKAHEDGVELLVFPEMALTAYSVVLPEDYTEEQKALYGEEYMQRALAPVIRGENPSSVITDLQAWLNPMACMYSSVCRKRMNWIPTPIGTRWLFWAPT